MAFWETFKEPVYFGNSIFQYLLFFGVIVLGLVLGKIVYYICKNRLRALASKSKNKFDDYLIDIIEEPIVILLFTVSIYIGERFLTLDKTATEIFDNLIFVLISITVTWFVLRFFDMLVSEYVEPLVSKSESKLDDQILPIIRKSIKTVIILVGAIVILSNLGYDILSVLAGLGIGGLAFALAAQDAVKNIIGGLSIFWDKPFQIDDWIKISGDSGTVAEVGIRSTRLRTLGGTTIVIPNSKVVDTVIENYSTRPSRRISLTIGLTYDTSYERMEEAMEIMRDTIIEVKGIAEDSVSTSFVNFGAYSLDIEIVYNITDMSAWKSITHEVNMGLKRNLDAAKIEMAFPTETHYVVQVKAPAS